MRCNIARCGRQRQDTAGGADGYGLLADVVPHERRQEKPGGAPQNVMGAVDIASGPVQTRLFTAGCEYSQPKS